MCHSRPPNLDNCKLRHILSLKSAILTAEVTRIALGFVRTSKLSGRLRIAFIRSSSVLKVSKASPIALNFQEVIVGTVDGSASTNETKFRISYHTPEGHGCGEGGYGGAAILRMPSCMSPKSCNLCLTVEANQHGPRQEEGV